MYTCPPGKVSSLDAHPNGKHVMVTVTHGKRKRSKGPDGESVGDLHSYEQPTSRMVMHKADAANLAIGDRVKGGVQHVADNEGAEDGQDNEDDETQEQEAPMPHSKLIQKAMSRQGPGLRRA